MHQWHFCINVWQCFANMCKTFTCFAGYRWNTDITPTMTSMPPVPAFRQNTARSRFSTCPTCAATQLHSYQEKTEATQTRWCLVLSSWFYASFTDLVPTRKTGGCQVMSLLLTSHIISMAHSSLCTVQRVFYRSASAVMIQLDVCFAAKSCDIKEESSCSMMWHLFILYLEETCLKWHTNQDYTINRCTHMNDRRQAATQATENIACKKKVSKEAQTCVCLHTCLYVWMCIFIQCMCHMRLRIVVITWCFMPSQPLRQRRKEGKRGLSQSMCLM